MDIKIERPLQGGNIKAIASKSEAHRLLISAALAEKETYIECPERNEDIDATVRCLKNITEEISYIDGFFYVKPGSFVKNLYTQCTSETSRLIKENELFFDCGESGSTLRFLLPVCGALGLNSTFVMKGRLPQRPLEALWKEMERHGSIILMKENEERLNLKGKLKVAAYSIAGNVSSQFISGLLFALPLLGGESTLEVSGNLESRPYVDMTIEVLKKFDINIEEEQKQYFRIKGNQTYKSPGEVSIYGDWSNAAFFLCAGAISEKAVSCKGLNLNSSQGDKQIINILKHFGAKITADTDGVTVYPSKLKSINIEVENIPDLVPAIAVIASLAEGKTIIGKAERLRTKESNRLASVTSALSAIGADIKESEDGLVIQGKEKLNGGTSDSFGDHRIAMMLSIASCGCREAVTIKNAEVVNKSYPGFFKDLKTLGAIYAETK